MSARDIATINREFYDALWSQTYVERPQRFNTWPLISGLLPLAPMRLEIGPGLRPRLPIAGTHFIDISAPVVAKLNALGGVAASGEITALPFGDGEFDLVGAFDVIEHIEDDRRVFTELSRVLKDGGVLVFAVPLHARLWTEFDDCVGHARRYEPADLLALLEDHQLVIERSATFGMQPNNPRLLKYGVKWLTQHRAAAMRWYNWVFMPLGMLFQKRLKFVAGLIDPAGVSEIVLVCRAPATLKVIMRWLAIVLGVFSFGVILAVHNISDGDLWDKLAIGAHVWKYRTVPVRDMFAFTPVLPTYIEHEWGAGTIFFGVLKFFGPEGLMALKILLAFGALWAAVAAGRTMGCGWEALLALAIPAAACVLPAYIPVVRSQVFTYCFFAFTLFGLEAIRAGKKWPVFVLPAVMLVWANVHGGFMAGLGAMAVYTAFALFTRQQVKPMLATAFATGAATLVNIYGLKFWSYLIPALLNNRPHIAEWRPLPLFARDIWDVFIGFRILFWLVVFVLLIGWRRTEKKSWPGLAMLAITAVLAWHSRRHTSFFGLAALAVAGPFLHTVLAGLAAWLPQRLRAVFRPAVAVTALYGAIAFYVAVNFLPGLSFQVWAPVGNNPVREVDILSLAQAEGNLALPFEWGGYCSWRLYPRIKISMDGRYETTFSESTFNLNFNFCEKHGPDWDRLIRDYQVDYIILELVRTPLRPEDLLGRGYALIWLDQSGGSALMALQKHAKLRRAAAELPPTTIDPLDASIPDNWWPR